MSPQDVTDTDLKIEDITAALDAHFVDSTNYMSQTYAFYSCRQETNQPFSEWLIKLKEKAQSCGFLESQLRDKPLDRALRDAILIGTNSSAVRERILKKQDPTLSEVIKIARDAEMIDMIAVRLLSLNNCP